MPLIREDCGVATLEVGATVDFIRTFIPLDINKTLINISTYTPFAKFYDKGNLITTPVVTVSYDSASGGIKVSFIASEVATLPRSGTYEVGYTDGLSNLRRIARGNFLKVL